MHPEIATAALVPRCQVVLLCKYIFSAVFSDLTAETCFPASQRLNFSFFFLFCDAKEESFQDRGISCLMTRALHHLGVI